jgi:putative transposase
MMTNHSHLIGTPDQDFPLGVVMEWLQTSVARTLNRVSGHTDHIFGGPYKGILIDNPFYFAHVTRYIFQNPIRAGLSSKVQDYRYSTVSQNLELFPCIDSTFNISRPETGIDHLLTAMSPMERASWFNELYERSDAKRIQKSLKRTYFKIPDLRKDRPHWLTRSLDPPSQKKTQK